MNKDLEKLAENLHIWYLEATDKEMGEGNFNHHAQKSYQALNEEQRDIDRYIAGRILTHFVAKKDPEEDPRVKEAVRLIRQIAAHGNRKKAERRALAEGLAEHFVPKKTEEEIEKELRKVKKYTPPDDGYDHQTEEIFEAGRGNGKKETLQNLKDKLT